MSQQLRHPTSITPASAELLCPNCNTPLLGHYCHSCGQKQRGPHDLTLKHFLGHAFHEFTHFDSKFLGSFAGVVLHPGKLTSEFFAGRESRYMKPLQLFIVVNVLYFLVTHWIHFSTFVTPLNVQFNGTPYRELVRPLVTQRVETLHMTFKEYEVAYNETTANQAKSLVILMVPIFAIVLAILSIGKRRFFVEHLVFSFHLYAFLLVLCSLGIFAVGLPVELTNAFLGNHWSPQESDDYLSLAMGVICLAYIALALRKSYGDRPFPAIMKSVLLTFSVMGILFIYRFILFFTTFTAVGRH